MFLGEYQHNLDHKGRVAVPKKFRKELVGGAILTKGLDGCLFLYPKNEWATLSQRLAGLPITQSDARAFSRYLFAGGVEVDFDSLGRIKIPEYLIKYASLQRETMVLGILGRVEIWSLERWKEISSQLEKRSEEIAEKLGERGI